MRLVGNDERSVIIPASMLGISYLELLFVLGLGSVILGPKDLPRVARFAGQATGRAAAYLTLARSKFTKFSEEAQLDKLHMEMQQSMKQLSAIQSELRGNINFMNPGPVAQRALKMQPPSAATAQNPSPSSPASFGPSQHTPTQSNPHRPSSTDYSPAASSFAASAADTAAAMSSSLRHTSDVLQAADRQDRPDQLTPLPISAVALGKAPLRSDSIPTGSDILLDALHEQEVAAQAQQFLGTNQGQAMLKGNANNT